MISDEQIKFYQKQLKNGLPDGELKEQLKREGFTKGDIDIIFKPHHYDMRAWYLIFGVLISFFGLVIYWKTDSLLILILGLLLFIAYYFEIKRLEKLKKMK